MIKDYRNAEQPGRYGPPEMIGTTRRVISGPIHKSEICTSHAERNNLTIRTFLKRFTRLSFGFSKKLANLEAVVALYVAHYNFCRWHGSLKKTLVVSENYEHVGPGSICGDGRLREAEEQDGGEDGEDGSELGVLPAMKDGQCSTERAV